MSYLGIKERQEVKKLLVLATLAGRIMLKAGAETYRVEDTVVRIIQSRKEIEHVDAFVIPTGIFISLEYKGELISYIKRIKSISIDLNKISQVNEFSRSFISSDISLDQGIQDLKVINKSKIYSSVEKSLFGSLASGFFTLMFHGSLLDFIGAFISSFLVIYLLNYLSKFDLNFFIDRFLGSFLASLVSFLLITIGIGSSLDKVIIGSIMPLVPGVAITNSIRDTMSGDFISGLSRGMEAIFAAFAIAIGVGLVILIFSSGVVLWLF